MKQSYRSVHDMSSSLISSTGPSKRTEMNHSLQRTGFALLILVANVGIYAQEAAPKTRAQVQAELDEARRTGDMIVEGEAGRKLNELYPWRYPQQPLIVGKTRAQVLAEVAEAQRTGDLIANGELGLKLNELHPQLYPKKSAPTYAELPASAMGGQ
jgi:hypothetical protein